MALKMKKSKAVLFAAVLCLVMLTVTLSPVPVRAAGPSGEAVRVGYYENEVFQEGANDDSVKTGYSYEYYQKLSEYTGWRYEYVYGEFGDLYQMLLNGEIDFLAGLAYREDRKDLIGYPDAAMGNEIYSLVKHEPYNLVLLDWKMPEMDGLAATEAIRALDRPDAKRIPIIAMTANAFDEDVQRSLQVGMNAHLSKPVEPDRLYQTLEELIWEYDREKK